MPSFFVTGATGRSGNQGGSVVAALLSAGQEVHAFTRNADSDAAKAVAASGATVFQGDFSDLESLKAASKGVKGVFLNVNPIAGVDEITHAQNVLAAAKANGVEHVIYTSVIGTGKKNTLELDPKSWYGQYWHSKHGIEEAVRNGGFKYWTILRPGFFMTNMLSPDGSNFMYPQLPTEGRIVTSLTPQGKLTLFNPADVGKFAAAAFLDPARFTGHEIDLGHSQATIQEVGDEMAAVSGKPVQVHFVTKEELPELAKTQPVLLIQPITEKLGMKMDFDKTSQWGIPFTSFETFLQEKKELLLQSIGDQKA